MDFWHFNRQNLSVSLLLFWESMDFFYTKKEPNELTFSSLIDSARDRTRTYKPRGTRS